MNEHSISSSSHVLLERTAELPDRSLYNQGCELKNHAISINNYSEFLGVLMYAGFTIGNANGEGIFTLCNYFTNKVQWHTEDKDTDPWEWRIRVMNERDDIAYAKLFYNKSGYITKDWYPYFYCVRRKNKNFYEEYEDGTISYTAKRIYDLFADPEFSDQGCKTKVQDDTHLPPIGRFSNQKRETKIYTNSHVLPREQFSDHKRETTFSAIALHEIKKSCGFTKEEKSQFDRAMIELQMKMYLTMCGSQHKVSMKGEEYGWNSTVFCKTEDFFDYEVIHTASKLNIEEAEEKIKKQIYIFNTEAVNKKIKKFIYGNQLI